jgi:hypothetical protein
LSADHPAGAVRLTWDVMKTTTTLPAVAPAPRLTATEVVPPARVIVPEFSWTVSVGNGGDPSQAHRSGGGGRGDPRPPAGQLLGASSGGRAGASRGRRADPYTVGMNCSVEGCDQQVGDKGARGWCPRCYKRWKKWGDPTAVKFLGRWANIEERFWFFVDRRGPDECWPWKGWKEHGYGYFQWTENGQRRRVAVHRFAYELLREPLSSQDCCDHRCHKPDECEGRDDCPHRACCNPAHIRPGPNAANITRGRTHHNNRYRTHCKQGHLLEGENVRLYGPDGTWRRCISCEREKNRRHAKQRNRQ